MPNSQTLYSSPKNNFQEPKTTCLVVSQEYLHFSLPIFLFIFPVAKIKYYSNCRIHHDMNIEVEKAWGKVDPSSAIH